MSDKELDAFCARVGRDLKTLRHARGLSQADVAQKVGLSRQTLSRVEMGDMGVALGTIFALAKFYKAPKKLLRLDIDYRDMPDVVVASSEPELHCEM